MFCEILFAYDGGMLAERALVYLAERPGFSYRR